MGKSRRYRQDGPERRKAFSGSTAPARPSLWRRAECCGATIAADRSRMGRDWADVHEPDCRVPWEILGLGGEPREVYPLAPYLPAGRRLHAVNRMPGAQSARHQAALRRQA